jgi:serine phosphatase RsbU (regulator of sigma subunit)
MSLLEQASSTNSALFERTLSGASDDFVTGLVGRLELRTGFLDIVNAGHVLPYLLRASELTTLDLGVDLPFGMFADSTYGSTHLDLEPGDRVVFVTDGMLERSVVSIELPVAIQDTRDLHPREVVRALADSALAAAGQSLQDDATVLCLDWHGRHHEARDAVSGAEPARASDPLA